MLLKKLNELSVTVKQIWGSSILSSIWYNLIYKVIIFYFNLDDHAVWSMVIMDFHFDNSKLAIFIILFYFSTNRDIQAPHITKRVHTLILIFFIIAGLWLFQTYFIIKADYFGETSILKRKTTSTIVFEPTLSQKWRILCTLESWPIDLKAQESKLSPCIQVKEWFKKGCGFSRQKFEISLTVLKIPR